MPVYDYKCNDYGSVSEKLFLGHSEQPVICPECGSSNMERLISSSYLVKVGSSVAGSTCCGRAERCESPPCFTGGNYRKT